MVVLETSKLHHTHKRLHAKLDHLPHHHQKPEDESGFAALQAFRAQLCDGLQKLIADSNEKVSFSWVEQGLKVLHGLNRGFKKLIEDVDCPMSKWGSALADEYLGYTIHLLDLFKSMSSSFARLQSVRLSLAHALSSPSSSAIRPLLNNEPRRRNWARAEEEERRKGNRGDRDSCHDGKQGMVLQALVEMKGVALWVCRVILTGLGGEMKQDLPEFTKLGQELPLLAAGLDSRVYGELTEVKEVNEMAAGLPVNGNGRGDYSKELQRKLETFQSKLEQAVEEVNCLFSQVMAARNRLMDCFRLIAL